MGMGLELVKVRLCPYPPSYFSFVTLALGLWFGEIRRCIFTAYVGFSLVGWCGMCLIYLKSVSLCWWLPLIREYTAPNLVMSLEQLVLITVILTFIHWARKFNYSSIFCNCSLRKCASILCCKEL